MKKIKIRSTSLLILVFSGLFIINSCIQQKETYQDRVSKCFKAAGMIEIEIDIEGKKGTSLMGNADPSCILGVSLPEFEMSDMDNNQIRKKECMEMSSCDGCKMRWQQVLLRSKLLQLVVRF